jgi:Secretion system C-terminal sorting domain
MKNRNKSGRWLMLASALVYCSAINGQRLSQSQPNYYEIREILEKRVEKSERMWERQQRKAPAGTMVENPDEVAFEKWDWYWKDRMLANTTTPGQLADVGGQTRAYMTGQTNNMRGPGGNPTTQTIPNVCTTGNQGLWSLVGPTTYTAPIMGIVTAVYVNPSNSNEVYAGGSNSGLFKTVNNGGSWTCLTDASRIANSGIGAIAVHPTQSNTIYIGLSSGGPGNYGDTDFSYGFGVMRSTDGGVTWSEVLSLETFNNGLDKNSAIRKLLFHPQDPNTMYALAGRKVFRTSNANAATPTWTVVHEIPVYTGPEGFHWTCVDIEILTGSSGVSNSKVLVTTKRDAWNLYNYNFAKVLYSSTGGAQNSFTDVTSTVLGAQRALRFVAAVRPGNNNEFFIAYPNDAQNGSPIVVKRFNPTTNVVSTVGTMTANSVFQLGADRNMLDMSFSKVNANRLYLSGTTLYSINLPATFPFTSAHWSQMSSYWATNSNTCAFASNTHADIRHLVVSNSGTSDLVLIGTDGGVCKSICSSTTQQTYTTANWQNLSLNGPALNQFFGFSGSETKYNLIVAGAQDNGIFEWSSSTWKQRFNYDGYRGAINWMTNEYYGTSNAWAIGGPTDVGTGVLTYRDGGPGNKPVVTDPNSPAVFYTWISSVVATTPETILHYNLSKSINSGVSWTDNSTFPKNTRVINAIQVAPSNSSVIYVAKNGPSWGGGSADFFYKSTDGGATWTDVGAANMTALNWASISSIAIDPFNANRVFVSLNGYWYVNNTTGLYTGANRVLKSEDGGTTWADITNGSLPACPALSLVYRTGSNDELYAGTDFGIYKYNSSTLTWECFSNQLPVVMVTEIEIHNCKNMIRASTYGRGMWESPLPPLSAYNVTANTTWTGNVFIGTDISIKPGVTLNLNGTLYMSKGKRIMVERGATLNINSGGKITNACGDLWEGIDVWGTASASQTTAGAQGKLVVNGGIIENANEAITTSKWNGSGWDFSYNGGIVQLTNGSFFNNHRSLQMLYYHSPQPPEPNNLSFAKGCIFETNRILNDALVMPEVHISMYEVKGVSIEGCKFRNTATSTYNAASRGNGIGTFDATFIVNDLLDNNVFPPALLQSSEFSGLTTGIQADFSSLSTKRVEVYNSTFTNVQNGITLNNSSATVLRSNTFSQVPNGATTNTADATWAIRTTGASSVTIDQNSITGASSSVQNNYGIVVDNGLATASTVTYNSFANLFVAIQAQGNNGAGKPGLQIRCNTFNTVLTYQIAVCPLVTGSIADQGPTCSSAAVNNFATPVGSFGHIYSPLVAFGYIAANGYVPTNVSSNVGIALCPGEFTCPDPNGDNGTRILNPDKSGSTDLSGEMSRPNQQLAIETAIQSKEWDKAEQQIALINDATGKVYYYLVLSMAKENKSWFQASPAELLLLETIAAENSIYSNAAMVVLTYVKGKKFVHDIEPINSKQDAATENEVCDVFQLKNSPNPFSEITTISCVLPESADQTSLVIVNSLGKEIQKVSLKQGANQVLFDRTGLSAGVYFYYISKNGQNLCSKKMIIVD